MELKNFFLDGGQPLCCLLELVVVARVGSEVDDNFLESLDDGGLEHVDDLDDVFLREKLSEFEYDL